MKIAVRKNAKKGTMSVSFRAESSADGVNLRDVVLQDGIAVSPVGIIDALQAKGYRADVRAEKPNTLSVTCSIPGAFGR